MIRKINGQSEIILCWIGERFENMKYLSKGLVFIMGGLVKVAFIVYLLNRNFFDVRKGYFFLFGGEKRNVIMGVVKYEESSFF